MKLESKKISDLKPAKYNPRTISETALNGLKASIKRFGVVEPIIVNKRGGGGKYTVVGGHQRLKVLIDSGAKEVDVVVVDLPEAEEKALNVTLNNPNIAGMFDDGLPELLKEIEAGIGEVDFEALNIPTPVEVPEYEPADLDAANHEETYQHGQDEGDGKKYEHFGLTVNRDDAEVVRSWFVSLGVKDREDPVARGAAFAKYLRKIFVTNV